MNDLRERLERLADAAAEGTELARPDLAGTGRPWWRRPPALAAAAALVVVTAATTALLVAGASDSADEDVTVGADAVAEPDAVVAVTYGDATTATQPWDLELRFRDADGSVIAERAWNKVTELETGSGRLEPGDTVVLSDRASGGLIQRVPPGELRLEATLRRQDPVATCTVPFTAAAGDRLILRLQADLSTGPDCGRVDSFDDWVAGRTGPTGAAYVGLTHAGAVARAQAGGLTTRVVALNGVDLPVTLDLQPNRLNLVLFDGIVAAAQLDSEEAMAEPPVLP